MSKSPAWYAWTAFIKHLFCFDLANAVFLTHDGTLNKFVITVQQLNSCYLVAKLYRW